MKVYVHYWLLVVLLLGGAAIPTASVMTQRSYAAGGDRVNESAPVEPDMHEFMEYLFQPPYKRLQAAMAQEPTNGQGWKAIKTDALILAEAGNLLLDRPADEKPEDWRQYAVQVRDTGGQLYRAGKAKDFRAARQHYESMLKRCNACHQQFADGEYQLAP